MKTIVKVNTVGREAKNFFPEENLICVENGGGGVANCWKKNTEYIRRGGQRVVGGSGERIVTIVSEKLMEIKASPIMEDMEIIYYLPSLDSPSMEDNGDLHTYFR